MSPLDDFDDLDEQGARKHREETPTTPPDRRAAATPDPNEVHAVVERPPVCRVGDADPRWKSRARDEQVFDSDGFEHVRYAPWPPALRRPCQWPETMAR
jgi:hypothetical protein